MTTRIGLVSDVHSSPRPLREALQLFRQQGVDQIICAGDIAGYYDTVAPTVELLVEYDCLAVTGNHDQSYLEKADDNSDPAVCRYLQQLPLTLELEIEQQRIFIVHANPPQEQHGGIRLLDPQGVVRPERAQQWRETLSDFDYDILIVGHTHQVYAEKIGHVWVVNPGSSAFNHSCMILNLPQMTVETFALGGREIVKCWNFSMLASKDRQALASSS